MLSIQHGLHEAAAGIYREKVMTEMRSVEAANTEDKIRLDGVAAGLTAALELVEKSSRQDKPDYIAHWDGKPTDEERAALDEIVKAAYKKMGPSVESQGNVPDLIAAIDRALEHLDADTIHDLVERRILASFREPNSTDPEQPA